MKGEARIDLAARTATLTITLEAIADAGQAMEMIRAVARATFPTIMFNDEQLIAEAPAIESFETPPEGPALNGFVSHERPPAPAGERQKRERDYTRPPAAGSAAAFVLEACARLRTTDMTAIADALDMRTNVAAMHIAALKRGGHLEGIACASTN
jgi:hypothetical protein